MYMLHIHARGWGRIHFAQSLEYFNTSLQLLQQAWIWRVCFETLSCYWSVRFKGSQKKTFFLSRPVPKVTEGVIEVI